MPISASDQPESENAQIQNISSQSVYIRFLVISAAAKTLINYRIVLNFIYLIYESCQGEHSSWPIVKECNKDHNTNWNEMTLNEKYDIHSIY